MNDDEYIQFLNRRIRTLNKAMDETAASSQRHTRLSSQKSALLGARAKYRDLRGDE